MRSVINIMILLAVIILIITGAAKLVALLSGQEILRYPNPIFVFLPNGLVLTAAAVSEIVAAIFAICHHRKRPRLAFFWIAWVATLLGLYRLALVTLGYPIQVCGCLGILAKLFYLSHEGDALVSVLLYFLLGSSYGGAVLLSILPKYRLCFKL